VSAFIFLKPRAAMTANIVKTADHRSSIPNDDQTFACDVSGEIIAAFCDLTLMPHQDPLRGKNLPLLLGKNLR
jgi:hypothetical protein